MGFLQYKHAHTYQINNAIIRSNLPTRNSKLKNSAAIRQDSIAKGESDSRKILGKRRRRGLIEPTGRTPAEENNSVPHGPL
jgi:hypothetical protein